MTITRFFVAIGVSERIPSLFPLQLFRNMKAVEQHTCVHNSRKRDGHRDAASAISVEHPSGRGVENQGQMGDISSSRLMSPTRQAKKIMSTCANSSPRR